jgi:hypothetical protein
MTQERIAELKRHIDSGKAKDAIANDMGYSLQVSAKFRTCSK